MTGRERLAMMIPMLRNQVKPETLYMPAWGVHQAVDIDSSPCGTSACAFGHAALNEAFRAEGLIAKLWYTIDYPRQHDDFVGVADEEVTSFAHFDALTKDQPLVYMSVFFGKHRDTTAAMKFFELDIREVDYLFGASSYYSCVTPGEVADRIEQFLANTAPVTVDALPGADEAEVEETRELELA